MPQLILPMQPPQRRTLDCHMLYVICITDRLADRVITNLISCLCLSTAAFISTRPALWMANTTRGSGRPVYEALRSFAWDAAISYQASQQGGKGQIGMEGATWRIYGLDRQTDIDNSGDNIDTIIFFDQFKCRVTLNAEVRLYFRK